MTVYLREHAPTVARPDFIATTAKPILEWWAGKRLSEIRGQSCRDYVEWRSKSVSVSTARHDLKTLRAAINHYHREHGPQLDRFLKRSEDLRSTQAANVGRLANRWGIA